MRRVLNILGLLLLSAVVLSRPCLASPITLDFEGLSDGTSVGSTFSGSDAIFANATVLTSGVSLNELEFPPVSGLNVVTDAGGAITITFPTPVDSFSAFFTYAAPLDVTGFGSGGSVEESVASKFSQNYNSSGNPVNELIQLASSVGFSAITIAGDPGGGSFVMDNVVYDIGPAKVGQTPEPPGIWLLGTGVLALFFVKKIRDRAFDPIP